MSEQGSTQEDRLWTMPLEELARVASRVGGMRGSETERQRESARAVLPVRTAMDAAKVQADIAQQQLKVSEQLAEASRMQAGAADKQVDIAGRLADASESQATAAAKQVDIAGRLAAASESQATAAATQQSVAETQTAIAKSMRKATWALVVVTAVLVLATILLAVRSPEQAPPVSTPGAASSASPSSR